MGTRGPLFRWDEVDESFSDRARLQAMLDFEGALARAEAAAGVIPPSAARVISGRCSAELFDAGAIADAAARAGNLAIPLVRELSALVARDDPEAARFVHYGATSQDAIDTGLVLQLRPALQRIEEELERLGDVLADMAGTHRSTVVAGRTWLQQAVPTSFGLKVAGWLDAVTASAWSNSWPNRPFRGTRIVTVWPRWRQRWASAPARSGRSHATSACTCRRRWRRYPSRRAKAAAAPPRCRTSAIRWARLPCSPRRRGFPDSSARC
jgi:hypothetical protein